MFMNFSGARSASVFRQKDKLGKSGMIMERGNQDSPEWREETIGNP
jgi:hypothetical protein